MNSVCYDSSLTHRAERHAHPVLSRKTGFAKLLENLMIWQQRAATRWQMQKLSSRDLHDLGLSPADVEGEAEKHFWQQ